MTAFFDYYVTVNGESHFDFEYQKVPHISLNTIANKKEPEYETLRDNPEVDSAKIRVSGLFTSESISSSQLMISLQDAAKIKQGDGLAVQNFVEKVVFYLENDGLSYPAGQKLLLKDVQLCSKNFIHATAFTADEKAEMVAISIGPEFGDVGLLQVEQAIYSALHEQFNWLIVVGFNFDEGSQLKLTHNKPDLTQLQCAMAFINPDIEIENLQKKPSGVQMFTVFRQAEINILPVEDQYQVSLVAVDTYNPQTGLIDSLDPHQISAWFIDENFDECTFFIYQAIFPNATKFTQKLQRELKDLLDTQKLAFLQGTTSLPFTPGDNKKIAVKIVDYRGNRAYRSTNWKLHRVKNGGQNYGICRATNNQFAVR